MVPTEVKPKTIYLFHDERGGSSETRANREIALLARLFTKSIRSGLVDHNPCKGVERFKETPRRRYIEDNEYLSFRNSAGDFVAAYMDFKWLTALRESDILALRLGQLKPDGIHVRLQKTGRPLNIEWSEDLRAAVRRIRRLLRAVSGMHLLCKRRGIRNPETAFLRSGRKR
jgi:integrase